MLHTHQTKNYQDDISIMNIFATSTRPPTFIKDTMQKLNAHVTPHFNSGKLQYPSLTNCYVSQTKTKQNNETTRHYESNGPKRNL